MRDEALDDALAWAAENADRHGPVDVLASEVQRLRGIEQRARNVREFIAFPRAEQDETKLAKFAEDVARIILGEEHRG